jgi:hypothetical protein
MLFLNYIMIFSLFILIYYIEVIIELELCSLISCNLLGIFLLSIRCWIYLGFSIRYFMQSSILFTIVVCLIHQLFLVGSKALIKEELMFCFEQLLFQHYHVNQMLRVQDLMANFLYKLHNRLIQLNWGNSIYHFD